MTLLRGCLPGAREGSGQGGRTAGPEGVQRSCVSCTFASGAAGTHRRMTRHLHATASPLNAFGTKVYAELVALPLPLPPARSRSGQTFPAYPAPMLLSSQSPKATQPTRLGAHQARWVHKGPGVARGTDVCQNWTVPGHRYGDGREGRCKWCWLTGYIFDTFNELIQTFHTRKDSPCYCCCALVSAYVPEACAGQGGDPAIRRTRGQGRRHTALHPSPPPFLGQNGLDAYSVAAICARWHSVIYTCSN